MTEPEEPEDEAATRAEELAMDATSALLAFSLSESEGDSVPMPPSAHVVDFDRFEREAIASLTAKLQPNEVADHALLAQAADCVRQLVAELRREVGGRVLH